MQDTVPQIIFQIQRNFYLEYHSFLQTWAPRKELLCGHGLLLQQLACEATFILAPPRLRSFSEKGPVCNFPEEAPSGSSPGLPDRFCRGPRRSEAAALVWPLCSSCRARSPCALSTHTWQVWCLPASCRPAATSSVAAH